MNRVTHLEAQIPLQVPSKRTTVNAKLTVDIDGYVSIECEDGGTSARLLELLGVQNLIALQLYFVTNTPQELP